MFGICLQIHHSRCTAKFFQADNFLVGDVNQLQPLAFMEAAQKAKVPVTFRPGVAARPEGIEVNHVETLSRLFEQGLAAADLRSPFWIRFVDALKALLISRALSHAYGPSESLVDLRWVLVNQENQNDQVCFL